MGRLATVVIAGAVAAGMVTLHPGSLQHYQTVARGTPIDHVAVIGDSYTTGTDEGGWGSNTWTNRTWLTLARQGVQVAPEVASEGRAGYVVRGDHGSVFEDLTNRAVQPDDALVVFFGSRNDHGVDPDSDGGDGARHPGPGTPDRALGEGAGDRPAVDGLRPADRCPLYPRHSQRSGHDAGATFIDPISDGWFVGRPDLIGPDGIHPNDAGHAYLAEKIAPLIHAQLSQTSLIPLAFNAFRKRSSRVSRGARGEIGDCR